MSTKYTTIPGDTINKITEKNHTTIKEFEHVNDSLNLKLFKDQNMLIPLPQGQSVKLFSYTTKEDDTINEILKVYDITYEELKYFNHIHNLILKEKQDIIINVKIESPGYLGEFENE